MAGVEVDQVVQVLGNHVRFGFGLSQTSALKTLVLLGEASAVWRYRAAFCRWNVQRIVNGRFRQDPNIGSFFEQLVSSIAPTESIVFQPEFQLGPRSLIFCNILKFDSGRLPLRLFVAAGWEVQTWAPVLAFLGRSPRSPGTAGSYVWTATLPS